MSYKLAIDFGTTNSVVARWNDETASAEIVALSGLSFTGGDSDRPPLIPSLLYVHDDASVTCGQAVQDGQLHYRRDNRLFRNFKRGIVTPTAETTRTLDGVEWSDRDAGRRFMRSLLDALPNKAEIDQLVLTAPVVAFEDYLVWLTALMSDLTELQAYLAELCRD